MAGVKSQKGPKHLISIGYLEWLGTHLGGIRQVEGDSVQHLVPGGQELAQVGETAARTIRWARSKSPPWHLGDIVLEVRHLGGNEV